MESEGEADGQEQRGERVSRYFARQLEHAHKTAQRLLESGVTADCCRARAGTIEGSASRRV